MIDEAEKAGISRMILVTLGDAAIAGRFYRAGKGCVWSGVRENAGGKLVANQPVYHMPFSALAVRLMGRKRASTTDTKSECHGFVHRADVI